jgi:hypothetical protein
MSQLIPKSMVLTGIGSEQDFKTGGTKFLLVFNDGELRVPVSETAAETVLQAMFQDQSKTELAVTQYEEDVEESNSKAPSDDDDGVDQV